MVLLFILYEYTWIGVEEFTILFVVLFFEFRSGDMWYILNYYCIKNLLRNAANDGEESVSFKSTEHDANNPECLAK